MRAPATGPSARSFFAPLALLALFGCRADPADWKGDTAATDDGLTVDADADGHDATTDCDDADASAHPGAAELCDGVDNDCDGATDEDATSTFYADADGDGYGDAAAPTAACEAPTGYVPDATDCDDDRADVHPDAAEADCLDATDYNCDGSVGYADADGDGFAACEDCDDARAEAFPGAPETCDGTDEDCDAVVDEDDAAGAAAWYRDVDGDGWGDDQDVVTACDAPSGYVAAGGDCADDDATYHPGATEACTDPEDLNCDGSVAYADADGDGHAACEECDDADAAVHPGAAEVCNGVDDDCDGVVDPADAAGASTWYADADGDGYGDAGSATIACDAPRGSVADASDCDDAASGTHPGAVEVCNGLDDDCDGAVDPDGATRGASTWYADADGDGYGDAADATVACDAPAGAVADASDCDDANAVVHPGGTEYCNDQDDDCDGVVDPDTAAGAPTWYADADHDGYGGATSTVACDAPTGSVATGGDCDDADAWAHPGATETCDGTDDDCDGAIDEAGATGASTWYRDADGDGYGDASAATATSCSAPSGYVADATDCTDASAAIHPGAADVCDAADNDCDGLADDDGLCPCDVEWDGSSVYMFCETAASWSSADATCGYYGYELVTVGDSAENAFVVDEAYTRYVGKWWTGYTDAASEGTWAWISGETATYTNWHSGEPNDSGSNEDCMQLGRYADYTWNDEPCSSAFRFVCEG